MHGPTPPSPPPLRSTQSWSCHAFLTHRLFFTQYVSNFKYIKGNLHTSSIVTVISIDHQQERTNTLYLISPYICLLQMARSLKPSVLPLLLFVVLLTIAQVTLAVRPTSTTDPNNKKQQTQSTGLPNKQQQAEAQPAKKQLQTQSTGLPNKKQQPQTQSTGLPNKQQEAEAHPSKKQQAQTKPGSKGKQTVTNSDKKETECFDHEGTVLIPGIGRYMIGSMPQLPTIGGTLGNSVPAAMNGQYLPGNDDTFVPNPGYEVPNPFHGSVP
ncbi:hypothetical protein Taro_010132 [Colocasia esculenta]|uniref:Uncharacterized protein n=1 Tax=Colocasia esculenta TaxID=4460 RepID=A0A843U637_COLES|nr:hypothetical protein [Colocasia esculenta]